MRDFDFFIVESDYADIIIFATEFEAEIFANEQRALNPNVEFSVFGGFFGEMI